MKNKILLFSVLSLVLILILTVAGCSATPASPSTAAPAAGTEGTINIGVATPITGFAAFLGNHMKNAILAAIEDQNAQGGVTIGGKKYKLNPIVRDTKTDPQVGKSVADELVSVSNVKVISGPFAVDMTGIQPVTEQNKVILFIIAPNAPEQIGAKAPFSYSSNCFDYVMTNKLAYLQKAHPDVKNILGMSPETLDLMPVVALEQKYEPQFGLKWIGLEKFPANTTDFMAVVSRVIAQKPDGINTMNTVGTMGPAGYLLIKQLREAGYKGMIWLRGATDTNQMIQIVGKENLYNIVESGIVAGDPLIPPSLKTFMERYKKEFNMDYLDVAGEYYGPMKAFFEFLNTQSSLDTTAWAQNFEKYQWNGIFGAGFWGGAPIYGMNRISTQRAFVSEWVNGALVGKEFTLPPSSLSGK